MTKRIAYNAREFWVTHAPVASPTLLETHYPKTINGGAGRMGWSHRIKNAQERFPELDWLKLTRGAPTPEPAEWPEAVYQEDEPEIDAEKKYGVRLEVLADGTRKSDRLIWITEQESMDPSCLMAAHGFDPEKWELVKGESSMWEMASKRTISTYYCKVCEQAVDGAVCKICGGMATKDVLSDGHDISTLYASKITVKPLANRFDLEAVLAALRSFEPREVKCECCAPGMLEIPLHDMHFGCAPEGCYDYTQGRIMQEIEFAWDEIVFAVGSDLFHNDNFRSSTAKGTIVDDMDYPTAWLQALQFYEPLLAAAVQHAEHVYLYYIKGNHDESMSWAFCNLLQTLFPTVKCDLAIIERKVHTYNNIAVGWTHGDKALKEFDRAFMSEFPAFAAATIREIHIGHRHHETVKDFYGTMVRGIPTANPTDRWHNDNGWIGANRRFQIFRYTETRLEAPLYI